MSSLWVMHFIGADKPDAIVLVDDRADLDPDEYCQDGYRCTQVTELEVSKGDVRLLPYRRWLTWS